MYINCLNFAVFSTTSGLVIAVEDFKSSQPLVSSIVRFYLYYHVQRTLYTLKVRLVLEKDFLRYCTDYDKEAFCEICEDYSVDPEAGFRNGYIFSCYEGSPLTYLNGDS